MVSRLFSSDSLARFTRFGGATVASTALVTAGLVSVLSAPARAASITVDGVCTLADAIDAANLDAPAGACPAGSGADLLTLTQSVVLDEIGGVVGFEGPNGTPSIDTEIEIDGAGFTIERAVGAEDFRLFRVGEEGRLTIRNATLRNGSAAGSFAGSEGGGAIYVHGSLVDDLRGQLVLDSVSVLENSASGFGDNSGGAISSRGLVELHFSVLAGNTALGEGGAIVSKENGFIGGPPTLLIFDSEIRDNAAVAAGGGLRLTTAAQIERTTVNGNEGSSGGGIYATDGLRVVDSVIRNNNAFNFDGGGVKLAHQYSDAGSVAIIRTEISSNLALDGGGISLESADLQLVSSTLSSNRATGSRGGGGIYASERGDFNVIFSTIAGNISDTLGTAGGIVVRESAHGNLGGAIVANNGETNCSGDLSDRGGNFDDDGSCPGAALITGLDPQLADNGGPTLTHALLPDSSAIDAGGRCGLPRDQRGEARPDGLCDSGAFEWSEGYGANH